jgi:hypothetical protein
MVSLELFSTIETDMGVTSIHVISELGENA